jgi:archaellum biogenesis protein FlaJ (TadC family)
MQLQVLDCINSMCGCRFVATHGLHRYLRQIVSRLARMLKRGRTVEQHLHASIYSYN